MDWGPGWSLALTGSGLLLGAWVVVTLGLCLPYPISRSLSYLFIVVGCCPRIFASVECASCLTTALEPVLLILAAPIGSPDVSPSPFDCPLGLGLPAYLALSIFSCVRTDCSNGSQ